MRTGLRARDTLGVPRLPGLDTRPFGRVFACIKDVAAADGVAEAAAEIASDSGAALHLARVLPGSGGEGVVADPVDWDIARRAAARDLEGRAEGLPPGLAEAVPDLAIDVLSGLPVPALLHAIAEAGADLVVLGRGRSRPPGRPRLGGIARAVAMAVEGSVMVVPSRPRPGAAPGRSVLVAVDGSPHSQAALCVARRIAGVRHADLVLLHALSDPTLAFEGPPDPEDTALRARLRERNARVARQRLELIRPVMPDGEGAVGSRLRLVEGGDPREMIARAVAEEGAGLLVIAARGSGRTTDLSIGSTADYLLSACSVPVLMVRGRVGRTPEQTRARVPRSRRPARGVA
ncbi:universal stress protein [Rhodovulum sp. 12E13]|uniref:universal stress protein n=1 Tax=Rhodovulum sp. 12E13 TaxID=2203891 RepID=UPI0013149B49|nr:universal stress protein [Rhodovulum sp. 12E13]